MNHHSSIRTTILNFALLVMACGGAETTENSAQDVNDELGVDAEMGANTEQQTNDPSESGMQDTETSPTGTDTGDTSRAVELQADCPNDCLAS